MVYKYIVRLVSWKYKYVICQTNNCIYIIYIVIDGIHISIQQSLVVLDAVDVPIGRRLQRRRSLLEAFPKDTIFPSGVNRGYYLKGRILAATAALRRALLLEWHMARLSRQDHDTLIGTLITYRVLINVLHLRT